MYHSPLENSDNKPIPDDLALHPLCNDLFHVEHWNQGLYCFIQWSQIPLMPGNSNDSKPQVSNAPTSVVETLTLITKYPHTSIPCF